ncbi:MAG: RagB/SusD family nutrient uptake outer membrane protein [Bacteroides sp.]|uniref:RagB/SusD family nutrient uptake outer membrane protein n=1 Tax=Bacteroides sp. TaxID=29523 RepID=UPI002FC916F1
MRKIILSISLCILMLLSGTSCSDYLNIVPEGTPTMDNAFSNRINAFKFLHTCYSYLPNFDNGGNAIGFLAGDEHWLMPKGTGFIDQRISLDSWEIGRGAQNSNNPYKNYWDGGYGGNNLWIAIRDCNIFLENIHKPKDVEDYERQRWISEIKFLKAFYHFYLFQLYGPIPIMDTNIPVDAGVEEARCYRDPIDEVVSYISNLLNESTEHLPLKILDEGEEMGRITQPIAKAVRAQLLVLAASPLFNGNPDYSNVKDNKGRSLFPLNYDENKWKVAADAALDAIETSEEAGHELYYFRESLKISDATRKLLDIGEAVTERWNKEVIWGSTRNSNGLQTQAMAKLTTGRYYEARSVLGPTLTVAEGFYSSNGVPISEDKGEFWSKKYPERYQTSLIANEGNNMYYMEVGQQTANLHFYREPRFYASLAFDRGTWYGSGFKDDTQAYLAKYRFRRTEVSGMQGSEDYSYTGYLNKKVCSYKSNLTNNGWTAYRYAFPIIRLADLYLMYAEALNESLSAPNEEVYKYIDLVRTRAGIPDVKMAWHTYSKFPNKPLSREGLREIIRMERLNELACEGKRFWDLRRWKIELPNEIRGWNVKGETVETFYRISVLFERTKFSYKDFLWPIKVEAIQKNPNLVQNPGW